MVISDYGPRIGTTIALTTLKVVYHPHHHPPFAQLRHLTGARLGVKVDNGCVVSF